MAMNRSFLFAPANRVELHDKVLRSGADIVCLDLEDAVPPGDKDTARNAAAAWVAEATADGPARAIRINPLSTRHGLYDLHDLSEVAPDAAMIVLPKVDDAAEIRIASAALSECGSAARLIALIESTRGLAHAHEIAAASPRLASLLFGAVDLSAELGAQIAPEPLLYARSRVVHAARGAGIDVFDVPCLNFRDDKAVRTEAEAARALGFTGKAAIHPANIETINDVFSPTDVEIAWARRVVDAYEASPSGLAVVDGKLVELPVVRSMRRILEMAATLEKSE